MRVGIFGGKSSDSHPRRLGLLGICQICHQEDSHPGRDGVFWGRVGDSHPHFLLRVGDSHPQILDLATALLVITGKMMFLPKGVTLHNNPTNPESALRISISVVIQVTLKNTKVLQCTTRISE